MKIFPFNLFILKIPECSICSDLSPLVQQPKEMTFSQEATSEKMDIPFLLSAANTCQLRAITQESVSFRTFSKCILAGAVIAENTTMSVSVVTALY